MPKFPFRRMKILILFTLVLNFAIIAEKDETLDPEATPAASTEKDIPAGETFTKCYGPLGCVNTDETWFDKTWRPVNLKPAEREIINTEFILIRKNATVDNEIFYQVMSISGDSIIKDTGYSPGIFLFVLIHDFTSHGYAGWVKHIAKVLKMRTKESNIISVDWHAGAGPIYDQAISNARVVALEIINLLKILKENHKLAMEQVHLIGHGVGAHIAGYVGLAMKPKKITGLDPNGPRFDNMPLQVRLDATDAHYVEVLHTDAMKGHSQGSRMILGHTDFFINDAEIQPGCPKDQVLHDLLSVTRSTLGEGEILPGCSHKRSYKYYIESLEIEECTFLGIKCETYEEFKHGKCTDCGQNCRTFGLVSYSGSNTGSYFLQTESKKPYCLFQYRVVIHIKEDKSSYYGTFQFILIDVDHFSTKSSMLEERDFTPGSDNSFVFYAGVPEMGKIVDAKVGWKAKRSYGLCLFNCQPSIHVDKIAITSINSRSKNSQEVELCPKDGMTEIQSSTFQQFVLC